MSDEPTRREQWLAEQEAWRARRAAAADRAAAAQADARAQAPRPVAPEPSPQVWRYVVGVPVLIGLLVWFFVATWNVGEAREENNRGCGQWTFVGWNDGSRVCTRDGHTYVEYRDGTRDTMP